MRVIPDGRVIAAAILAVCAAFAGARPAAAQAAASPYAEDRGGRRLFQRFVEDAAIVPGGWIEGVFTYDNQPDNAQRYFLGGQFAFRLGERAEAGLRLGFVRQEFDGADDGSGIADIDVYGKYRFGGPCAAGGIVKIPSGDEGEGIGTGQPDVEGFFACRADFAAVSLAGSAGIRYNGKPDPPLPDSEASVLLGGGLLIPAGTRTTFVIEATWESERLSGAGNDARLTFGYSGAGPGPGFGLRVAVALPLSDAAPDYQVFVGAAWLY
ncbi:MAG TPA: hypothetical protein VMQ62_13465 [Dongiaceae bacterium]|nr:hypothetical protein [Dongiaceae bacterium]